MVQTLDEILKEHDQLKSQQLPPAEHDPECHMSAHAGCEWWWWATLEVVK